MPRDLALLKKININNQSDLTRQNIGSTNFVFGVYENDLQFTPGKQIRMTAGTNKLIQSILKCLLTPLGSALEDAQYGADLETRIGEKIQQIAYSDMQNNVRTALEYLMTLNANTDDPDEAIAEVDTVKVVKDTKDPRVLLVYISVIAQSGKRVSVQMPQVA